MTRSPAVINRTRILVLISVVAGCYYSALIACGEGFSITQVPKTHNCDITSHDSGFPDNGHLHIDEPVECPFALLGLTDVVYAAHGSFVNGTVTGFYRLLVTDLNGNTASSFATPTWTFADSTYLQVSGDYYAGAGGFGGDGFSFGSPGHDDAHNILGTYLHGDQEAVARLDYEKDPPRVNIDGPTGAGVGVQYTLNASIHDVSFVSPVTWTWYLDGQQQASTTSEFSTTGSGDDNSVHEVDVNAVDGNGQQLSSSHFVTTCPDHQIQC